MELTHSIKYTVITVKFEKQQLRKCGGDRDSKIKYKYGSGRITHKSYPHPRICY